MDFAANMLDPSVMERLSDSEMKPRYNPDPLKPFRPVLIPPAPKGKKAKAAKPAKPGGETRAE